MVSKAVTFTGVGGGKGCVSRLNDNKVTEVAYLQSRKQERIVESQHLQRGLAVPLFQPSPSPRFQLFIL